MQICAYLCCGLRRPKPIQLATFMGLFRAYGVTAQGPVRPTNEDCFGLDDQHGLCVVADGMGGHNAGEVAAQIAVNGVTDYVRAATASPSWPFGFDASVSRAANVLRSAVYAANAQVFRAAASRPELAGMGTTIVAALVQDGRISVAHAGDSRVYLFTGGRLRLLTTDDCWAFNPHVLTNALGTREHVDVHVVDELLSGGELAVLTTDGVHGAMEDGRMERLLAAGGEPPEIAGRLVRAAVGSGSRDNCTAVVSRCNW